MRNYLFSFLVFFLAIGIGLSNDYNFTITGDLPVKKMSIPSDFFQFSIDFGYQPKKRELTLKRSIIPIVLSLNPPTKHTDIFYTQSKMIKIINVLSEPPEKLKTEVFLFDEVKPILFYKPIQVALREPKTGGIAVNLTNRKEMEIPEIVYNSKVKTYQVSPPPIIESVNLKDERVYLLKNAIGYNPLKEFANIPSRISIGTLDLNEYRFGFTNPYVDALVSNNINHFYLKSDSYFIGAQASLNEITALASFPGFHFKLDLFNDTFIFRTTKEFKQIPSFDFGLAMLNTAAVPIVNWYTKGSANLFSIGMDIFERSAYGVNIRLKNYPFVVRGSTGYNFSTDAFHAVVDGRYNFNKGLLSTSISYNDGLSITFGTEYQLIKNNPFSMMIYGNIDYCKDWLFSAGTRIKVGDLDLGLELKFITGGLSVDVEAGYSY